MALAVGTALVLALRNRRALDPASAGVVGAAIVVVGYWLLHGSIDFFWELPALAAPAFGLLALAASVQQPVAADRPSAGAKRRPLGWRVAPAILAILVTVAAIAAPGLAEAYEQAGLQVWRRDARTAYARLDTAARINPLSARPLLYKGSIATIRRDEPLAERSLLEAVDREPANWYGYLQLALLAGSQRDFGEADALVARARTLNPRDRVAAVADRLIRRRVVIAPQLVNDLFLKKERARFLRVDLRELP
jgi:tetratricopeptide (TPR) repeat protein